MEFMSRLDKPTGEVTDAVDTDDFGGSNSRFGLKVHVSVQGAQRGSVPGIQAHNAGLWWTGVGCAMRSYVDDCGGQRARGFLKTECGVSFFTFLFV